MGDQLLPCPFCGDMAEINGRWGWVNCTRCHTRGPVNTGLGPVGTGLAFRTHVEAWNHRALSARAAVPEFTRDDLPSSKYTIGSSGFGHGPFTGYRGCDVIDAVNAWAHRHCMLAAAPQPAGEVDEVAERIHALEQCYNGMPYHDDMLGRRIAELKAACPAPPEPAPSARADVEALIQHHEMWANDARESGHDDAVAFHTACLETIRRLSAEAVVKDCLTTADVEALAGNVGVYTPADPSCGSDRTWTFSAEGLHDFARRLSGPATGKEPLQVADVEALVADISRIIVKHTGYPQHHFNDAAQEIARRLSGAQQAAKDGAV